MGDDFWAEVGEYGRWVGVHGSPRTARLCSSDAARGPVRKTRLKGVRSTQGVDSMGRQFIVSDNWSSKLAAEAAELPWTGKIVFIVDRKHDARWGTDQRRQRSEAMNFGRSGEAWADIVDSE